MSSDNLGFKDEQWLRMLLSMNDSDKTIPHKQKKLALPNTYRDLQMDRIYKMVSLYGLDAEIDKESVIWKNVLPNVIRKLYLPNEMPSDQHLEQILPDYDLSNRWLKISITSKAKIHQIPALHVDFMYLTKEIPFITNETKQQLMKISSSISFEEDTTKTSVITAGCHFYEAGVATITLVQSILDGKYDINTMEGFTEATRVYTSLIREVFNEIIDCSNLTSTGIRRKESQLKGVADVMELYIFGLKKYEEVYRLTYETKKTPFGGKVEKVETFDGKKKLSEITKDDEFLFESENENPVVEKEPKTGEGDEGYEAYLKKKEPSDESVDHEPYDIEQKFRMSILNNSGFNNEENVDFILLK